MVTVGTLAYNIVANTGSLTSGVAASRTELRTLKSVFLESMSPTEKYTAAIAELERLAGKFPEKAGQIQRTIHAMRVEMDKANQPIVQTTKSASSLANVLPLLGVSLTAAGGMIALHKAADLARSGLQMVLDIASKVHNRMEALDETAKKARLLGVSEEALVGLRRAASDIAGVGAEGFEKGFTMFTRRIAEAAMEGKGEAFDALNRLGLDAAQLSQMTPDQALLKTANAIQQVQNPAERLQLAFQLLGRQGVELATMLAAGDEAILKLMEDSNKLQNTDFINFEDIEEANDALGRAKERWEGILNLLASEFAPIIAGTSDDIVGATDNVEALRDQIQYLVLATQTWVDRIKEGSALLKAVLPASHQGIIMGVLGGGVAGPGEGTRQLMQDQAAKDQERRWKQAADLLGGNAGIVADTMKAQIAAEKEAANETEKLGNQIESLSNRLKAQVDMFGMSSEAIEVYKLKLAGASDEQIASVKSLSDQLAKLEANKKAQEAAQKAYEKSRDEFFKGEEELKKRGKDLAENLRTPFQVMRDDLKELQELRAAGAITKDTFVAGLKDLRSRAGGTDVQRQPVEAIRAGSVEALRAEHSRDSIDEKSLKTAEEQLEETKNTNKLLTEVRTLINNNTLEEAP